MSEKVQRVTVRTLQSMKKNRTPITMLTAYDYPTAKLLDESGIDTILVGDSLGMVVQGKTTTVPVTIEEMIYHGEMVARAVRRAMVIVDLPFPVGQLGVSHTVGVAAEIMKKTECHGVKMEGAHQQSDTIRAMVEAGIPTIAHIGLRPQSIHALGGYRVHRDRARLMEDAQAAAEAGAFALLMECVQADLAQEVTQSVSIPTIGIGAGAGCDGQVLVTNDMLGWNTGYVPKFARKFANLGELASQAITSYRDSVISGSFPGGDETID